MALKNAKLREQFEANALQTVQRSDTFVGVCLHVNGHTVPSALVGYFMLACMHMVQHSRHTPLLEECARANRLTISLT